MITNSDIDQHTPNCDVLIVGAGPTGLTLAIELARRGISYRIIDKAPHPSQYSKALGVMARTLELLHQADVAETLIAQGHQVTGMQASSYNKVLAQVNFNSLIQSPYPYVLMVPQSITEKVLMDRLLSLGGTVERQVQLTALQQSGQPHQYVQAIIQHTGESAQSEEQILARWVVGCDGAHSTVRHLSHIAFEGEVLAQSFALADVQIDWKQDHNKLYVYLNKGYLTALFPMLNHRHRVIIGMPPDHSVTSSAHDQSIELADIQAVLDICLPIKVTISDPIWLAKFAVHQRKVKHYRTGRIFLAGDAAHIHSPIGGQGMNTGIQDAFNLGWKLALVCQGYASDMILDSYHAEREPIGRQLLRGTSLFTRLATTRYSVPIAIRNTVAPLLSSRKVIQKRLFSLISETGLAYPYSPIVQQGKGWQRPMLHAGERAPDGGYGKSSRHTLLLFTGEHPVIASPKPPTLEDDIEEPDHRSLLTQVAAKWDDIIDIHILLPDQPLMTPLLLPSHIHIDSDNDLHQQYGMGKGGYVLIRPDGYISYIGNLNDEMDLIGWVYRSFQIPARPLSSTQL